MWIRIICIFLNFSFFSKINLKVCIVYLITQIHKQAIVDLLRKTRNAITQKYGYQPNTGCVLLPNLSEEEKIDCLWLHSEKMALAWALLPPLVISSSSSTSSKSSAISSSPHSTSQQNTII
jgi:hypothetical protein